MLEEADRAAFLCLFSLNLPSYDFCKLLLDLFLGQLGVIRLKGVELGRDCRYPGVDGIERNLPGIACTVFHLHFLVIPFIGADAVPYTGTEPAPIEVDGCVNRVVAFLVRPREKIERYSHSL